jgi:AAA+ superfamily predicted ATPase
MVDMSIEIDVAEDRDTFVQLNSEYLSISLDQLFDIFNNYVSQLESASTINPIDTRHYDQRRKKLEDSMPSPPLLEQLCRRFSLTDFERYILLFCAALEVDPRLPRLCAIAHNDNHFHFTFGLALAGLPNPHWSAIAPHSPLRYWQLIKLDISKTLTNTPLRIDERILHYLMSVKTIDAFLTEVTDLPQNTLQLVPSHHEYVENIKALWWLHTPDTSPILVQLSGSEIEDKTDITQTICNHLTRRLSFLDCRRIPLNSEDLTVFIRRLDREFMLSDRVLLLNCDDVDSSDQVRQAAIHKLLEDFRGFIIVSTLVPMQGIKRSMIRFDIPKPDPQEQLLIWENSVNELQSHLDDAKYNLEPEQLSQDLQALTAQFQLSTSMIRRACSATAGQLTRSATLPLKQALWQNCRIQARPKLDELAERIESRLSWDDLVLPPLQKKTLQEISAHVRQRATVYEDWGFAAKNRRGLGLTALFSGPSGTGKTFAAGVLANELNLDLYKIELSSVVSKYIGETEKNLQRIFDAAESGGVILLFDEADSIFGKRSEVSDAKDRYANLEVSYLLQRMESYGGLAILTTNLQNNLDAAFMRRIRFVTQFSLPDAAHRAEIWRRMFPAKTPTEGLNFERLAQLNTAGGNIRIIALNAAFMAADVGEPIGMKHILQATQIEYEKLGKSLTSVEISGWVNDLN